MSQWGNAFRYAWEGASGLGREAAKMITSGTKKIGELWKGETSVAVHPEDRKQKKARATGKAHKKARKKLSKKKIHTPITPCPNPSEIAAKELSSRSSPEDLLQDARVKALLDVIAYSEGADYNTMVKGEGSMPITDFSKHPNVVVKVNKHLRSTAAGRYQFLHGTWEELDMDDFTPTSQDLAAIKLLKRRNMISSLLDGDIEKSIKNGNREWASLPGSPYGQPTHSMDELMEVYNESMEKYRAK